MSTNPNEYSFGELLARNVETLRRQIATPMVSIEGNSIVLYDRYPDGDVRERYDIDLASLDGGRQAAFWVRQLAPKHWVSKRHLEMFASTVVQVFGLD